MSRTGAGIRWMHRNFFANSIDKIITVITLPTCAWVIYVAIHWAIELANWTVIPDSLRVMMVGIYPAGETWRAWAAAILLIGLLGASLGTVIPIRNAALYLFSIACVCALALATREPASTLWVASCETAAAAGWLSTSRWQRARQQLLPAWLIGLIAVFAVLAPPGVETWGGLLLSTIITIVTSILTLPLGILLAFGRRSRFASLRVCCTAYIEVMRSVPLILVVYWVWIVVPLLSTDLTVPDVVRGMVGFVAFFSAYVAEFVRSGLQGVPKGQVEAAQSVGLSNFDVNYSIVLPQAIRFVVPALVGNVLDIFNAAPLVFIIGLTDFLRAGQMVLANPQFSSKTYEVYAFLFAVYFAIGSLITYGARRLEIHLANGSR